MSGFSKSEIEEMKQMFLDDGVETLNQLETQFQILESDYNLQEPLVEIYRLLHSLKGMAGTIGLVNFEKFFHNYESFISSIQEDKVKISKKVINFFFRSLDVIESGFDLLKKQKPLENYFEPIMKRILELRTQTSEDSEEIEKKMRMKKLFEQYGLEDFTQNKLDSQDKLKKIYFISITIEKTVRLKVARLFVIIRILSNKGNIRQTFPEFYDLLEGQFDNEFSLLFQSKENADDLKSAILDSGEIELVEVKEITYEDAEELLNPKKVETKIEEEITTEPKEKVSNSSSLNTVKVSHSDLDKLMEYFGELLIRSTQLEKQLESIGRTDINEIVFEMQNYMFNLQDIVLQIQMVPISIAFRVFPRMVRRNAQKQQKKVKLLISHHDSKVDRKILNDLGDILNHTIRNALSHGIEKEDVRIKNGKNPEGYIKIETTVQNNVLTIIISDDGQGIDLKKVKKIALKKNLFSRGELADMTDNQVMNIIFMPNFSTSEKLDKISGRGLGLNIVKQKVEKLGGSISVSSQLDIGTTFTIQLPIARTLIRALLVRVADQTFSIPLEDIEELMEVSKDDITEINDQKFIFIPEMNQSIKIYHLNRIFQLTNEEDSKASRLKLVYIQKGSKNFALVVDEFLRESEIVIKRIECTYNEIKGISGAAILDDGSVSLIIDAFTVTN